VRCCRSGTAVKEATPSVTAEMEREYEKLAR
jgi:hypothetical protein